MTYRCRYLRGSWGHAGRKPRVFRCLASKTRHRENRGFLPACPCDPRRQAGAGGWRLLPIFRVLLFAHHHVNSTFSDLETPVCRAPFLPALPQRNKGGQKQKTGEDFCCSPRQLLCAPLLVPARAERGGWHGKPLQRHSHPNAPPCAAKAKTRDNTFTAAAPLISPALCGPPTGLPIRAGTESSIGAGHLDIRYYDEPSINSRRPLAGSPH